MASIFSLYGNIFVENEDANKKIEETTANSVMSYFGIYLKFIKTVAFFSRLCYNTFRVGMWTRASFF